MNSRVLVLSGEGINCERETARAFNQVGIESLIVPVRHFLERPEMLLEFQIFALPGGFSFGDEISSGQVLGLALKDGLKNIWPTFLKQKGLCIGICNGFQILMKMGVFGNLSLVANAPHAFQDRWIDLKVEKSHCVWSQGLEGENLYLPIRHGEGRIWAPSMQKEEILKQMTQNGNIVLRYEGDPNGSLSQIAGLCDSSGQVFGLMPHPEAALNEYLVPEKTKTSKISLHSRLFENAKLFAQENRS